MLHAKGSWAYPSYTLAINIVDAAVQDLSLKPFNLTEKAHISPKKDEEVLRFSNRHALPKQSARCVQRFDDSRNSAIHTTYRISLRSSSLREPRDPLSKVVFVL